MKEIDLYKPAEKVLLLNRLLNGEADDSQEIAESFGKIGIKLDASTLWGNCGKYY